MRHDPGEQYHTMTSKGPKHWKTKPQRMRRPKRPGRNQWRPGKLISRDVGKARAMADHELDHPFHEITGIITEDML